MDLFCQTITKIAKSSSTWTPSPDPLAFGMLERCPQKLSLQRLRASPVDPQWPLAAGAQTPKTAPISYFWLRA